MGFFNGLAKGLQSRQMFEEDKRARRSDEEYREWQKGMAEREFGLKEREIAAREAAAGNARRKREIQQANELNQLAASLGLSTPASADVAGEGSVDTQMDSLAVSSAGHAVSAAAGDPRGDQTGYSASVTPDPTEGPQGLPYAETAEGWTAARRRLGSYFGEAILSVPLEDQEVFSNTFQTILSDEEASAKMWDVIESYENAGMPLSTDDLIARIQLTDARLSPEQRIKYAQDIVSVKLAEMQDQMVSASAYSRALRAESALANQGYGLELNFDTGGLMPLDFEDRQRIYKDTADNFSDQVVNWMYNNLSQEATNPDGTDNDFYAWLSADEDMKDTIGRDIIRDNKEAIMAHFIDNNIFRPEHLLNNPGIDFMWQDVLKDHLGARDADPAVPTGGKDPEDPVVPTPTTELGGGAVSVEEGGATVVDTSKLARDEAVFETIMSASEGGTAPIILNTAEGSRRVTFEDGRAVAVEKSESPWVGYETKWVSTSDPDLVLALNTQLPIDDTKKAEAVITYMADAEGLQVEDLTLEVVEDWISQNGYSYTDSEGQVRNGQDLVPVIESILRGDVGVPGFSPNYETLGRPVGFPKESGMGSNSFDGETIESETGPFGSPLSTLEGPSSPEGRPEYSSESPETVQMVRDKLKHEAIRLREEAKKFDRGSQERVDLMNQANEVEMVRARYVDDRVHPTTGQPNVSGEDVGVLGEASSVSSASDAPTPKRTQGLMGVKAPEDLAPISLEGVPTVGGPAVEKVTPEARMVRSLPNIVDITSTVLGAKAAREFMEAFLEAPNVSKKKEAIRHQYLLLQKEGSPTDYLTEALESIESLMKGL